MRLPRRGLRAVFLLALLAFLAHLPALSGVLPGAMPSTGDTLGAFVPWHAFSRQAVWQRGEIPLWNPHLYCGMPFLANGQSGLLYPPTYLHFLLPENLALWLFACGHSYFYMLGGYFLGRVLGLKRRSCFLVALLLGLGSAIPGHLFGGHLTFLPTRSYWPWEAAFLLRWLRGEGAYNAIAWAACLALGLAAGAPQIWFFGLLFNLGIVVVWAVGKIRGGRERAPWPLQKAVLGLTLLLLWCAPLLLPLQELKPWSSHGNPLSFAAVTQISATPKSLFRLALDGFYGGNSFFMWSLPSNPTEDAASIGAAGLILAGMAPFVALRRRVVLPLFVFCGLMLVLSLGKATPLYRFLYDHVSLFQLMRVPARWLELWAFGAALLAGFTLDGILLRPRRARRLSPLWAVAALGCFALLVWVYFNPSFFVFGAQVVSRALAYGPEKWPTIAAHLQGRALLSCFYAGVTLALLAWFWRRCFALARPDNRLVVLVIVLLGAEPVANFWFSTRTALPVSVSNAQLPLPLLTYYQEGQRWIVRAPFGQLNAPLLAGIDAVNGYEPFGSRPFFQLAEAAQGHTAFSADFKPRAMHPLWRVVGASHLLWKPRVPGEQPFNFPGRTIARAERWRLNSLEDGLRPWPRSYLTRQVVRSDEGMALSQLQELARKPWVTAPPAVVSPEFPLLGNPSLMKSEGATLLDSTPDARLWKLASPRAALFVENETMAPGWKAFVDAKPSKIYAANGVFRGVYIPAGASTVAMVLDSETLRFSLFLALCGLGLAASVLVSAAPGRTRRARRPTIKTPS